MEGKFFRCFCMSIKKGLIGIIVLIVLPAASLALNPTNASKVAVQSEKVKYASKLVNYGIKSITHADLALASKADNITTLLEYERNAGKINELQVHRYIKGFNSFDNGDELLLKCLQKHSCNIEKYLNTLKKVDDVNNKTWFSQSTIAGKINWQNSVQKGHFGEYYTYSLMGRDKAYTRLKLKIGEQGIDHVYVKYNPVTKKIDEVLIIETKTDRAPLAPGQMSDDWIKKNLNKIMEKGDNKSKEIAKIIMDKFEKEPDKVKKMLYRHNLENGTTTKTALDKNGIEIALTSEISNEYYPMKQRLTTFAQNKGILEK